MIHQKQIQIDLMSSEQEQYEVQRIVAKRTKGNQVWYLVKWIGYSELQNTWEPIQHLNNAPDKIKQFEQSKLKKRPKAKVTSKIIVKEKEKEECIEEGDKYKLPTFKNGINTKRPSPQKKAQQIGNHDENTPKNYEVINLLSQNSEEDSPKDVQKEQSKICQNNRSQNYKICIQNIRKYSSRVITIKQIRKVKDQVLVLFECKGRKYKTVIDTIKKYHSEDLQSYYDRQIQQIQAKKYATVNDQK